MVVVAAAFWVANENDTYRRAHSGRNPFPVQTLSFSRNGRGKGGGQHRLFIRKIRTSERMRRHRLHIVKKRSNLRAKCIANGEEESTYG